MKKCYRFLQYYLIKGFLTILEGNYEICMKSRNIMSTIYLQKSHVRPIDKPAGRVYIVIKMN